MTHNKILSKAYHEVRTSLLQLNHVMKRNDLNVMIFPDVAEPRWSFDTETNNKIQQFVNHANENIKTLMSLVPVTLDLLSGVREYTTISFDSNVDLCMAIRNCIGDCAARQKLIGLENITWYVENHTLYNQHKDNPWDTACRERLVRTNSYSHGSKYVVIEPGCVWFVKWIESLGGSTISCCEGHPYFFYVYYVGPLTISKIAKDCGFYLDFDGPHNSPRHHPKLTRPEGHEYCTLRIETGDISGIMNTRSERDTKLLEIVNNILSEEVTVA